MGLPPFPPLQMDAVRALCASILSRHAIPGRNVIGHSDAAPNRKQDPGELFDWQGLAAAGIGLWPSANDTPTPDVRIALNAIGYDPDIDLPTTLRAFQRHWRPNAVTGDADAGTLLRVEAVHRMIGP
jgi:N-acetylmuramoyl-L-alanine amidase